MRASYLKSIRVTGLSIFLLRLLTAIVAFGTVQGLGNIHRVQAASFQVSPSRFEFSLERRFTDFFIVTNNSDRALRLRVYPMFMHRDGTGKLVELQGHPYDMSPWLVLNPRLVRLQPGDRRIVRFSVRPPAELDEGEYRTVLLFEELPGAPTRSQPGPQQEGQQGLQLRLKLLTRLGVSIYGLKGERRNDVAFVRGKTTIESDRALFTGNFTNRGNAHVLLSIKARLVSEDDAVVHEAEMLLVLQRERERPWQLVTQIPPPGTYYVHITGSHRDSILIEESFRIDFKAPAKN